MEDITLGQIKDIITFIVALSVGIFTIYKAVMAGVKKVFEPTDKKIDEIGKKIDKVDKNATMNYIVRCFNDIDRGVPLDSASMMRLKDQYSHYINDLHGNTYIHDEYERLKKEGKL